jgi:hypothetical protein
MHTWVGPLPCGCLQVTVNALIIGSLFRPIDPVFEDSRNAISVCVFTSVVIGLVGGLGWGQSHSLVLSALCVSTVTPPPLSECSCPC